MAVEARHLSFFPSRLLTQRELMGGVNEMNPTPIFNNGNTSIGYVAPPLSGTTTETLHPIYNSVVADSFPPANAAAAAVTSRKRSRDSLVPFPAGCPFPASNNNDNINNSQSFSFLGEDMTLRIQHQQFEIEQFISQHTEKLRMEIEERRKRQARRILAAVEQGVMNKIRAREEEIESIGKLNWALEERVKSLYMENQIWRDLAQTNEATVNTLRINLEQVLAVVRSDQRRQNEVDDGGAALLVGDEESCCGSNIHDNNNNNRDDVIRYDDEEGDEGVEGRRRARMCRKCCREEASVLLLPCRHLCLCSACGSCVHVCPVCKATKNASVHINLSS